MADFVMQGNLNRLDFSEIAYQYGGSEEYYLDMEDARWEQVKCPFCFNSFTPFRTHYRIPKEYVNQRQDDESNSNSDTNSGWGGWGNSSAGNVQSSSSTGYETFTDASLSGFWRMYGQSKGNKMAPVLCGMRITESRNVGTYAEPNWQEIEVPGHIQSWRFLVDSDGFPGGMEDTRSGAVSTERLCPFCHNTLPFEYGKYPVKFIAVVGITRSGKTVYLSSLLEQFDILIGDKTGLSALTNNREIDEYVANNTIRKGAALPQATNVGNLIPPLPKIVSNYRKQRYTLVFFDIAGENCVKADQMAQFGGFIRNADGIVMIIDPKQFADTFEIDADMGMTGRAFEPEYVLKTMFESFLSADCGMGRKCQIPIALSLSKSDLLRPYFYNSPELGGDFIFEDIDYNAYEGFRTSRPGYEPGYAYDDGSEINELISDILNPNKHRDNTTASGRRFYQYVDSQFANKAFFAFSALSVNPDGKELESAPMAVRIEEPVNWLLYKMGVIPAMFRTRNGGTGNSTYDAGAVIKINGGLRGATAVPDNNNGRKDTIWPFGKKNK